MQDKKDLEYEVLSIKGEVVGLNEQKDELETQIENLVENLKQSTSRRDKLEAKVEIVEAINETHIENLEMAE